MKIPIFTKLLINFAYLYPQYFLRSIYLFNLKPIYVFAFNFGIKVFKCLYSSIGYYSNFYFKQKYYHVDLYFDFMNSDFCNNTTRLH